MTKLSQRIKLLRKEHGFNQEELALKLGVSRSTVAGYETDKRKPDHAILNKLADYFDVSIDYLLGRTDQRKSFNLNQEINADIVKVPIVGTIQAGQPILANENIEGYRSLPAELLNGENYFFLKVEGDSMIGSGIRPGSYVLIRQQADVENGEIAAVLINDIQPEATLKKVYKSDGKLVLQPDNSNYEPIIISKKEVKIIGKAVRAEFDLNTK